MYFLCVKWLINELIIFIEELVINEAYRQTKIVIKEDMKKWEDNDNEFKKWELFAQEREFNEIHKITGIGKPSLSKKFKFELVALAVPLIIFSAKNVSYAIAIPTISNKIANKALKPELSILSPNFCPS